MGECLIGKQQYVEALICVHKTHKIYETQINWEKDSYLARTLNNLSICLMEFQKYADALNCMKQLLKNYKKVPLNENMANKIESISCKIDKCSLKLG